MSDFGSGHDLTVHGLESRVGSVLTAGSLEPGACFRFCVSLSLCPSPVHALSLSVSKINVKKKEEVRNEHITCSQIFKHGKCYAHLESGYSLRESENKTEVS